MSSITGYTKHKITFVMQTARTPKAATYIVVEDIFLESHLNAKKPVGSMSAKYVAHMFPFISFPSSDWHINHGYMRMIGIRLKRLKMDI